MMKFFRKHNKKLLAVFMALLLIVWLGGSALQSLLSPSVEDRVLAKTDLGDIIERDRKIAEFETGLLENLGLNWQRPWPFGQVQHEPLSVYDWIVLTREADRAGMMPRNVEIDAFLGNFGLTPERVHRLAFQRDVKSEQIYKAIGQYIGVFNEISLTVASFTPSESEVRIVARDELEKVKVKLVSLNAASFNDPQETFTEEQIREHFEKYRGEKPGKGVQFGYYQPAEIKVQYFKIDVAKVADGLRVRAGVLEDRARDYWRENKTSQEFRRPEPPADQAAGPQPSQSEHFETFEEAREAALGVVRRQIAKEEIATIEEWLIQQLSDPWIALPDAPDRYKVGTGELLDPGYYQKVLSSAPSRLRYENAITIAETDFVSRDKANSVPDIGSAQAVAGAAERPWHGDAFMVQGIETIPDDARVDRSRFLAVGQSAAVPYRTANGDGYIFRVVAVKPAGPADDLEAVREKVISDLHLLKGYERAKEAGEQLLATARSVGLQATWDAEEYLKTLRNPPPNLYEPIPLTRVPPGMPPAPAGLKYSAVRSIRGLGSLDGSIIAKFFELEDRPVGQRIDVFTIDENAIVAVVEWQEKVPVRRDEYQQGRQQIAQRINNSITAQRLSQWLDPVRIRDRHDFTITTQ